MPVRGRTRHDPPMPKQETKRGLFVTRGDGGPYPQRETLKYALGCAGKHKAGGKRTLTR